MTLLNFTAVLLGITLRTLFELWKLGWRMSVLLARPVLHPARPPVPRKVELNPRRSNTLNHHLTTLMTAGPASAAHILTFLQWMRAVSAKKVGTRWGNSSRESPLKKISKLMRQRGALPPASDAMRLSFQQLWWLGFIWFASLCVLFLVNISCEVLCLCGGFCSWLTCETKLGGSSIYSHKIFQGPCICI